LINTAQTLNQQFAPSGFAFNPSVNVNAQGQYTGQITPQKKTNDPLTQLYQQQGLTPPTQ
jgi:hypothetical protein